jgi:membrane protein YqaA with SNARE-associated domain
MTWIDDYGYLGLFFFCLLAATIIPVSSESALVTALLNDLNPNYILLWATFGNCLGTVINYLIGLFIGEKWIRRQNKRSTMRAIAISEKYGWPALFLSWLPVIGDPITIFAGVFRWNAILFIVIVFSLRFLRYYLIVKIII